MREVFEMFRIKICGITCAKDAFEAVRLRFHALGFIFAPGPRKIDPDRARAIIRILPPMVATVGVFVDEEPSFVRHLMSYCGLDLVQFHGPQTPRLCARFLPRSIKSIHLKSPEDLSRAASYIGAVRALHFDTHAAGGGGGTGMACDWGLAREGALMDVPIILAGGLGLDNAVTAITEVSPFAIDVNSGVEERPGVKDHALMKALADKLENFTVKKHRARPG
jgi:phosphoribosylanthranilate isomerase